MQSVGTHLSDLIYSWRSSSNVAGSTTFLLKVFDRPALYIANTFVDMGLNSSMMVEIYTFISMGATSLPFSSYSIMMKFTVPRNDEVNSVL